MSDNRTAEFLDLAQSIPATISPSASQNALRKRPTQDLRSFHTTAAGISRDIGSTSALLQELADLVRHQSSMDQHASVKMNQMVVRSKSSIENLNTRIDDASNKVSRKRNAGQADQQAANLVNGLQEHFAEAANDFKNILQERTDVMEEQRSMQKQVYNADEDDDEIPNLSMTGPPPVFSNNHNNMGFPSLDLTSNLMAAGQPTGSLPRPHGIPSCPTVPSP